MNTGCTTLEGLEVKRATHMYTSKEIRFNYNHLNGRMYSSTIHLESKWQT